MSFPLPSKGGTLTNQGAKMECTHENRMTEYRVINGNLLGGPKTKNILTMCLDCNSLLNYDSNSIKQELPKVVTIPLDNIP